MIIKINGKSETVGEELSLTELILHKSLVPEHIVIEHNARIVSRAEWSGIRLADNDRVEIVSFVGGG